MNRKEIFLLIYFVTQSTLYYSKLIIQRLLQRTLHNLNL